MYYFVFVSVAQLLRYKSTGLMTFSFVVLSYEALNTNEKVITVKHFHIKTTYILFMFYETSCLELKSKIQG